MAPIRPSSEAAIEAGNALVADLIVRTAGLRGDLASVPYVGTPTAGLVVSEAVIDAACRARLRARRDRGLDADWARLTAGSVAATRMSGCLAAHDRLIGEAVAKGRLAKYDEAIPLIDQAAIQISAARDQRNDLVQTVDVSVLDEWLDRNGAYDVALQGSVHGHRRGGQEGHQEDASRGQGRGGGPREAATGSVRLSSIIMADIGRVGMNGAVIGIEEARAALTEAIDAADAVASDAPERRPVPDPGSGGYPVGYTCAHCPNAGR